MEKYSNLRLLYFFVLLPLVTACSEPLYSNLDNTQLQIMLQQKVPVYDIRRAQEWQQTGVIEGSQLLTFVDAGGRVQADFLSRFTAAVGKDDAVILICRTGSRTRTLARHLTEEMGYSRVFNVRNGITGWIRDDLPVIK